MTVEIEVLNFLEKTTNEMISIFSASNKSQQEKYLHMITYYSSVKSISENIPDLDISEFDSIDIKNPQELMSSCFSFSGKIKSLKFIIENSIKNDKSPAKASIRLDENWRTKIRTYINIIKEEIEKTPINDNLRHSILEKLNKFSSELDRTKTKLESFNEAFVDFSYAMAAGYENLKKPANLFMKVIQGLNGIYNIDIGHLPSPEELKLLSPPEEIDDK